MQDLQRNTRPDDFRWIADNLKLLVCSLGCPYYKVFTTTMEQTTVMLASSVYRGTVIILAMWKNHRRICYHEASDKQPDTSEVLCLNIS